MRASELETAGESAGHGEVRVLVHRDTEADLVSLAPCFDNALLHWLERRRRVAKRDTFGVHPTETLVHCGLQPDKNTCCMQVRW
jgi:hypothetical protein